MRVVFLHGAANRRVAAADWLRRRCRDAATAVAPCVVYVASEAELNDLDRWLWAEPATGFLPHCRAGDAVQDQTPIVLTHAPESLGLRQCLLNLSHQIPPAHADFSELVEIVSTEENDKKQGRERFRFYREQGHEINSVDISAGIP